MGYFEKKTKQKETREHRAWRHMKERCCRPKTKAYRYYGARGIGVCQRWLDSFDAFLEDMGICPPLHTLERINNNGNYEPDNCRWATYYDQNRNRRMTRFITYGVETLCTVDWAKRLGIRPVALRLRIDRYGWTPEDAVSTPKMKRGTVKRGKVK